MGRRSEKTFFKRRQQKGKINKHQTKILLHSKENHKQDEKATYGMGENICKPHIQ